MENLKRIEDIFATLHDGTIENWNGNSDKLCLKISCKHLAEIVDEKFEYFYIELYQIHRLELLTYSNKENDKLIIINNLSEIFCEEIDVFYAKTVENYVEIKCWQINDTKDYVANKLLLNCENIRILNEESEEISDKKFLEIGDYYWGKFSENK